MLNIVGLSGNWHVTQLINELTLETPILEFDAKSIGGSTGHIQLHVKKARRSICELTVRF